MGQLVAMKQFDCAQGEVIVIGDPPNEIHLKVLRVTRERSRIDGCKIAIDAPKHIRILRAELLAKGQKP